MSLFDEFVKKTNAINEFDACQDVVARYFPEVQSPSQIDLPSLAKGRGIQLQKTRKPGFEGMIERDSNGIATIVIREGLSRRRERFTLAHELGHWILQEELLGTTTGRLFRGVSRNESEVQEEVRLASLIAAEILMPFDRLSRSFDECDSAQSLVGVCREFGVSRTAAVRRIADVIGKNLMLVQIVPYLLNDTSSIAEVDDSTFATSRRATLIDRERTKFVTRPRYSDLLSLDEIELDLKTPKGRIKTLFDLDSRPSPIPHTFALALISHWPN